jgi:hypothetical protein
VVIVNVCLCDFLLAGFVRWFFGIGPACEETVTPASRSCQLCKGGNTIHSVLNSAHSLHTHTFSPAHNLPRHTILQHAFLRGALVAEFVLHVACSAVCQFNFFCRVIYPLSVFGITWVSITAVLLAYTALVTPPVIAFHWLDPDCTAIPTYV